MTDTTTNDHQEVASNLNIKFRKGYSKMVTLLGMLILLLVILVPVFIMVNVAPSKPGYYATATNGVIYPLSSLDQPVVTDTFLQKWVSTLAGGIFTVSFGDWQSQLDKYKGNFTPLAWQDLQNSYNKGFADNLVQNQWSASAVITQEPRILDRRIINGRYTWTVNVPVLVNFTNASANASQSLLLALTISRMPTDANPQGIQVTQFLSRIKPGGGDNA